MKLPNFNASLVGLSLALSVAAGIFFGSNSLVHFDAALTGYAVACLVAAFAVGYRFTVWAGRPPSRRYFVRGFELLFQRAGQPAAKPASPAPSLPVPYGAGTLAAALARNFIAQDFIRRRSGYRWIMHLCLSGGCTLAFAITFPLVFGWIHFEAAAGDAEVYRILVLGLALGEVNVHGVAALLLFNGLNIAAVLVLIGLGMAGYRRMTDAGERATQTFAEDILPLIIILIVAVTGLALTVSYKFLDGRGHALWAIVHLVSVVALLLFIPFGKLFHMFQRTCALCVSRYKAVGEQGPRAHCRCCGEDYASQMHVDDLKVVLEELGFNYRFADGSATEHYQDVCPGCRRRRLALNQGRSLGR